MTMMKIHSQQWHKTIPAIAKSQAKQNGETWQWWKYTRNNATKPQLQNPKQKQDRGKHDNDEETTATMIHNNKEPIRKTIAAIAESQAKQGPS